MLGGGLWLASAGPAAGGQRVFLSPKFSPGETIFYQIEMSTISTGKTVGPISNPEGGSRYTQKVSFLIRLEVLPAPNSAAREGKSPPPGADGPVRLRLTYEKVHAESESDTPPIEHPSPDEEIASLQGRSIEFTIEPGGQLADLEGLSEIVRSRASATAILSWIKGITLGAGFPSRGITVGKKWTTERPFEGSPLAGLVWRAQSIYLRNEPCATPGAGESGNQPSSSAGPCAVILTRYELVRRGSARGGTTPPDYLRNGLRTSGTWTGAGQSLDSLSLSTGMLASSTQSSVQHMDYQIVSAATGEAIHQTGQVRFQTAITRVPAPQSAGQSGK